MSSLTFQTELIDLWVSSFLVLVHLRSHQSLKYLHHYLCLKALVPEISLQPLPQHDPLAIGSFILNIDVVIKLRTVISLANAGSPQGGYIGSGGATEMRGDLLSASPSH